MLIQCALLDLTRQAGRASHFGVFLSFSSFLGEAVELCAGAVENILPSPQRAPPLPCIVGCSQWSLTFLEGAVAGHALLCKLDHCSRASFPHSLVEVKGGFGRRSPTSLLAFFVFSAEVVVDAF